jgi:flavin-dependent dehydrogenase
VVIAGGGLAGLTLALQLRREVPEASVTVLDRLARPLPEAAFKVGESTVEIGACYLARWVGLEDHLLDEHIVKLGLRFFFGDAHGPFEARPELGIRAFPPFNSYQIDRGRLENHLRERALAEGVELMEGWQVEEMEVADAGPAPHRVTAAPVAGGQVRAWRGRWLVDATGRRRMLQRRLGLTVRGEQPCSAAWLRVRGKLDVDRFVAGGGGAAMDAPPASPWHDRVPGNVRHHSTVHLMGDGYWVWLIPLGSGATSVGIVADNRKHPVSGYNTLERALEWIGRREPVLARALAAFDLLDFLVMDRYSYSSTRILSPARWACVGEAGVFPDPFYSPGTDLIGFANTVVTELVRRDRAGRLEASAVDRFDAWLRRLSELLARSIHGGYAAFGHAVASAAKIVWDLATAWGTLTPKMYNRTFVNDEASRALRTVTSSLLFLQLRMQALFQAWAARGPGRLTYDFLPYLDLPFLLELGERNLRSGKPLEELLEDHRKNMAVLEALAVALFRIAVEDVLPGEVERVAEAPHLNVWGVGLEPDRWEEEGLFQAGEGTSHAALAEEIRRQIRGWLAPGS